MAYGLRTEHSSVPSPFSAGTADILPRERAGASFDVKQLQQTLYGKTKDGPSVADEFRDLFSGPPFNDTDLDSYRSYEDKWRTTMKRTSAALEIVRTTPKLMVAHKQQRKVNMGDLFATGSLGIHFSMFLTQIKTQCTEEQQAMWLAKSERAQMFGAYAQTELGHGSNLRGLETTATFDKATDEFVIHSPYLTSLKWWPTGMYCCTHGAVMANLIIDGTDYGFHGFMVQFRDEDGKCMPGVEIGEMGPKINGKITNIGYARFTEVRIPRFNMFARASQVTRDGEYKRAPPKLSKFKYISMMEIRRDFVGWSSTYLGRASTIAIRYSCIRHQGYLDNESPGRGENAVLNYKMQQYRLFKALSLAYVFFWNHRFIGQYLGKIQQGIMDGDDAAADELPMLHATLCGFKVFATVIAHANIEECRKACGGQGFLSSSGIAHMPAELAEAVTAEGEQVILSQQLSRFLVKEVRRVRAGSTPLGQFAYLKEKPMQPLRLTSYSGALVEILALMKFRAQSCAMKLEAAFSAAEQPGHTFENTLNEVAVIAWKAAESHTFYAFLDNNHAALNDYAKDPACKAVMGRLLELSALQSIRENGGDFIDVLDGKQLDLIMERINTLLTEIRPDAVSLVDAFGNSDVQLGSTLGRYDGDVYEAIYEEAKKSPLNQAEVMLGWEDFSPNLDLDFLRDGKKVQHAGPGLLPNSHGAGSSMAVAASKL